MRVGTLWEMMGGAQFPSTLRAFRLMEPLHRVAWLAAASRYGVLTALADGEVPLATVAQRIGVASTSHPALGAWLRHGVLLKELRASDGGYALRGSLARRLARADDDTVNALVEAYMVVHQRGIYGVMERMVAGETMRMSDLDPPLVARVAEMAGPIHRELLDRFVPSSGAHAMLELGCGSGSYLRHACQRNPDARAVGVDFDPEVAAATREQLAGTDVGSRIEVVTGDFRSVELHGQFDTVAMFNLIYYLPQAERAAVIARAAQWVAPGGALLLTSNTHGGTIANNMLDIWFSSIPECGPLPTLAALTDALREAGLSPEAPRRLLPGEEVHALVGRRAAT